jgi:preprotein translocase subunit SecD
MKWGALLREPAIILLIAALAVAGILVAVYGLHFGLEFNGGVRIPITLQKPVDQLVMSDIVNTIKTRATKYGMMQVDVTGVGNSEVYVDIPMVDPATIQDIENILQEQGNFEGIVDGKVAVTGADMMPGSIIESPPTLQGTDVQWAVTFAITQQAATNFANVVYGKSNYPVYMFLDRPENSIVIIKRSDLFYGNVTITEAEAVQILEKAADKQNDSIPVFIEDDFELENSTIAALNTTKKNAIISQDADPLVISALEKMNYNIINETPDDMRPVFYTNSQGEVSVDSWGAVNLLSAPVLSPDITEGRINQFYEINGIAQGSTYDEKEASATAETKKLKSILTGGALPVRITVGTPTTIQPSLGAQFLQYSAIGVFISAFAVSFAILLRYKEPRIVIPIVLTLFIEMIITLALVGSVLGTIDLGVMAGVIGAAGNSVNDQIVITDELLKGKKESADETKGIKAGIAKAFFIVLVGALTSTVALLPLLFSGLVDITGFAISQMLDVIISIAITRPAFAKFMEKIFEK